jgi:cytochrome c-type biogenesis protein CcmE
MIRRYWKFLVPAVLILGVIVVLLINLSSNLVYFHTPTELHHDVAPSSERLRLGGQVVAGTVVNEGDTMLLRLTDGRENLEVIHNGVVPQLFKEGQGVIVEGTWDGSTFHSDTMLIRHDEQYRTEDNQIYDSIDHELESDQ